MTAVLLILLGACIGFGIRPMYVVLTGRDIPCRRGEKRTKNTAKGPVVGEGMTWNWPTIYWKVVWYTPLARIRWFRRSSTAAWCRWHSASVPTCPRCGSKQWRHDDGLTWCVVCRFWREGNR